MRFALTVAMLAIGAGLGCLIHAFVPALCQRTCSRTIASLQTVFADRRCLEEVRRDREAILNFVGLAALGSLAAASMVLAGGLTIFTGLLSALCFALPTTYLLTNRELLAVDEGAA